MPCDIKNVDIDVEVAEGLNRTIDVFPYYYYFFLFTRIINQSFAFSPG